MAKLDIDKDVIRELAEIMNETGMGEIEVESGDKRLRVSRATSAPVPQPAIQAIAPAVVAAPVASDPMPASSDTGIHPGAIKSPMVGTIYLAAEPTAANFISIGDNVSQGQTLLIIEAMKTMNPIPAPKGGKVVEILVTNEEPVEFDQPLVIIE
jgi:acetyl-CoA carboxylase biotin carboxyl carrier protein